MVSGHYVAPSITQYMAQALKGWQAGNQLDSIDKEQNDYYQGELDKRKDANKSLVEALKPKTSSQDLDYNDVGMPGAQQTVTEQPDINGALLQYISSGYADPSLAQYVQGEANWNRNRTAQLEDRTANWGHEDTVASRQHGWQVEGQNAGFAHTEKMQQGQQEFQRIMQKESQGFALSQQEKQFANQWKLQQSSQGFQAGQNALSRASEAKKTAVGDWKYDSGSDTWVSPPTPENPNGKRILSPDKKNAANSLEYVLQQFEGKRDDNGNVMPSTGQIGKTTQGGFMGIAGKVGKITNYQEAKRFDNLREQLSTELRTLFRIPGEGALSDKEQAQYGMQLPSVDYDPEINQKIITDIRNRVSLRQGGGVDKVNIIPQGEPMPKSIRYDKNGNRIP